MKSFKKVFLYIWGHRTQYMPLIATLQMTASFPLSYTNICLLSTRNCFQKVTYDDIKKEASRFPGLTQSRRNSCHNRSWGCPCHIPILPNSVVTSV